ncbi:class I SAM-dependent methyltransferase [Agromyces sp. SYSU K20354]|uniref:class I SAM-dependent methyltransferase n=1 Tax=Agromyces cavernae TaxID=2898659 RepID=UPI001E2F5B1B|nr:class I SAM-dependent methyltransferase [Agromyces cavernae]MCD2441366.1 class I SAM-dependent methyltransferase [Agromyces cavernae]
MGDTTGEPDFVEGSAPDATSFADLDELIWNPISTAAVARAHPRFDELVLDACARDGASALPTAELVGVGGLVDAVDASAELIEIARERAGERMPQLRLHVADPTTWETTGYDLVQCVLGVSSFPDLDAGVQHLIERARPGGRVAITVWAHGALEPLPEVLTAVLPDAGADVESDAVHAPELDELHTAGTLAHWLTGLGLVGVRAEAVQRHVDLTDEIAWTLVLGTDLRAGLGDLEGDEAVAEMRERYLRELAHREVTSVDLTTLIAVGQRPEESA